MSRPEDLDSCIRLDISDDDIYDAMKDIQGYLDITPADFKEVFTIAYRHAVERITRSVKAKDVMTVDVLSVSLDTPLVDVAKAMAQNRISGIPVVNNDGTVAGIISEKDFLAHMGAEDTETFMGVVAECLRGKGCVAVPIRAQKAKDIMTFPAITAAEDTPVFEIANMFTAKNINRVPVLDDRGNLTGIVSRADIIRASSIKDKT